MKTNTITTIVLVGIVAFCLAACSKSEAPTQKITERTEPHNLSKNQEPTTPPLDREALALVEKAFSEEWTQVGDSWFILHKTLWAMKWLGPDLIQIKGANFQVRSEALSQADTLNGLQWKGQVEVFISLKREYGLGKDLLWTKAGKWDEWKDASRLVIGDRYTVYTPEKKHGQWTIRPPGYHRPDHHFDKPTIEQIKSLLTP